MLYVRDFGDGQRGGGASISHAFASAGTPPVTLSAIDAAGRRAMQSHGATVSSCAASGQVTLHVAVVEADGAALSGVALESPGIAAPLVTTDAMGKVDVTSVCAESRVRMIALRRVSVPAATDSSMP